MTNTNPNSPLWTADDYATFVTMSGARKLADSQVAPLVAHARGYSTVDDKETATQVAERARAASTLAVKRRLTAMIAGDEDVLVIPWYRASNVAENGTAVKQTTVQFRPSVPLMNKDQKLAKYEFVGGSTTTLDFNPATPVEWITSASQILMTEGVIKGDSALTAQLMASGIAAADLKSRGDVAASRTALEEMMLNVPAHERIAILSFAGVANWRAQTDWVTTMKLQDRRVLVAFDGDVTTNYNVWKQARALFEFVEDRKGEPRLVNLASHTAEVAKMSAGLEPSEKLGLDDYLSKVGDWEGVLSLVEESLPAEPDKKDADQFVVGQWRVAKNGTSVEEYAQEQNFDGSKAPAGWVTRVNIGGRILSAESKRRPSRQEIQTGVVDPSLDLELSDSNCVVEVSWVDENDQTMTSRVSGPTTILAYPPNEWDRKGGHVPDAILLHPEWPPRKGAEWLSAIKAHRIEEIEKHNAWDTMGWVPVDGGDQPAFIVGSQVLGRTEEDEKKTIPGVTDKVLGGAGSYGVIDNYWDLSRDGDEAWKRQTLHDIRTVTHAFLEMGVWKDRSVASAALAAMLRPTIPAPAPVTLYIYGPPRAGKTFTASFIMGGWQCTAGTWTVQNLPGSAGDTLASTEYSISKTPIWPADDLAPSIDARQAVAQEAAIGNLIRGVHNGSGRRRMDGKTMQQREVSVPTALFIITAENEPQVESVRERIIALPTPRDAFGPGEAIKEMQRLNDEDGASARLTAAMIRYWTFDQNIYPHGWKDKIQDTVNMINELNQDAAAWMEEEHGIANGEGARHGKMASELGIVYMVLAKLATYCGMPANDPLMEKLSAKGEYVQDLFDIAARTVRKQRKSTPGRSLVSVLAKLMASGRAHVRNPNTPGHPPVEATHFEADEQDVDMKVSHWNSALGWAPDPQGQWVPKGISIGHFGMTGEGSKHVVLFDAVNAFKEAQKNYPDKILPGQNGSVSWSSVWTEELADTSYKRRPDSNTVRARIGNGNPDKRLERLTGVPVLIAPILDEDWEPGGTSNDEDDK